jgi:hypothetical protein
LSRITSIFIMNRKLFLWYCNIMISIK